MQDYASLIDAGFLKAKLKARQKRFPTVQDVDNEISRIKAHDCVAGLNRLRVYFYDAPPATGRLRNPIDGSINDLSNHPHFKDNVGLHQRVEMMPDVALRQGETSVSGWALGNAALKDIDKNGPRMPAATDFVPKIEQKGVDLRIGLDIARLSLPLLVSAIVVVTGDSDMVPAFKFARREGMRVYLDHMGHGVKRDLKVHVDRIV